MIFGAAGGHRQEAPRAEGPHHAAREGRAALHDAHHVQADLHPQVAALGLRVLRPQAGRDLILRRHLILRRSNSSTVARVREGW